MTTDLHGEEEILGKAYDARLMARILRYLRPYWKLLTVAFTFLLLYAGTQLLGPYITKIAIDRYIVNRDVHGLDLMAAAYLGVVLLGFIFLSIFEQSGFQADKSCLKLAWNWPEKSLKMGGNPTLSICRVG